MKLRQYRAAKKVIDNDCQTTGSMVELPDNEDDKPITAQQVCKMPVTCAVGTLAFAAYGWKLSMRQINRLYDSARPDTINFKPFASRIKQKFGLKVEDLQLIMEANDYIALGSKVAKRRAKVRQALKQIAREEYRLKV